MPPPAKTTVIPLPSLRRLPTYLYYLKKLAAQGREVVSCTRIAAEFGQDPTQVRKDLAGTGITGKPKVGYPVAELIRAIEHFLGWDNRTDAFLAGAGNLGSALMGYQGFAEHGLNIVAAFDTDPAKVGTSIHGKPVMDLEKLPALAERMKIRLGIIAVPVAAAQGVADLMVRGGIQAIWNFSPAAITIPPQVIIEREDLSSGLAVLSRRLTQSR